MTRVLLISPSSVPGGAERALVGLAKHLPGAGFDVKAVLLQHGRLEDWLSEVDCPVTVLPPNRTRQLHRTAVTVARLAHNARRCDVVVSNQSKGHVYGGLAAAIARRPAVWWQQGTPERSRIESVAARVPAAVVVASSTASVAAQRHLTPKRRVELVALGTDLASVQSRAGSGAFVRSKHGWASDRLVGIVGRLQEWKGQDVFLRAAALIAGTHPDVKFLVVGGAVLGWEGDYPQRLQGLARDLGIADRVHFAGHQDDVYPWFDALDVVVHASFGEPFGLVLVEAMALGKPLIATNSGGPADIVEHGTSGLLVPPGNHEAMADALIGLLDDSERSGRMGSAAALRAQHFDESAMAGRFADLLSELAS